MKRRRILLTVLASAVLLAGCTTVPTSGPVTEHSMEPSGAVTGVRVAPLPPAEGATKLLIVEGFLHAMSTSESDYQVAREYLTETASRLWKPQSGVQVYADGYPPTETDQTVVLVAPLAGLIDAGGVYHPERGQLRQDFGLVKNSNGQWRISRPPKGLLMSRYLYSTSFTAIDVEFEARTGASMVPDPHHFPDDGTAESHAVQAVLDGPSSWLAPIVTPRQEKELTLDSVEVSSFGTATVALSNGTGVTSDRRTQLLAELAYTLCSFPQISAIRVVVDGQAWTQSGSVELRPDVFPDLDPADSTRPKLAFVVSGGKLERQAAPDDWSDNVEVRGGLPDPGALAVSRDLSRWAITSADKTQLIAGTGSGKIPRPLRIGTGLLRPSFGRNGDLWSPAAAGLADLRVYRDGKEVPITISGMPTSPMQNLALAADGSRVAMILGRGSSTKVGLARVSYHGDAITLSGWAPINIDLIGLDAAELLDVGWSSISELALLRRDPQQQIGAVLIAQDGSTMNDIGPSDVLRLDSLLVVPGRDPVGLSSTNSLYRFDGEFNWFVVDAEADAAAYSG